MAQSHKYKNLPGLDTAPDVYETPELTEDTTVQVRASNPSETSSTDDRSKSSTARSPSQASDFTDDSEGVISGIDRRKISTDQARTQFSSSRVDARGVDFSDRIRYQRRSYRTSSRRPRSGSHASYEYGDLSDEEDEDLGRKLARLRREVEEVKQEYELRSSDAQEEGQEETADHDGIEEEDPAAGIAKLSEMLDAVYTQRHGGVRGAEAQFERTLKKFARPAPTASADGSIPQQTLVTTKDSQQSAQALAKVSDFDSRLSQIEKALGLNATNMPDIASNPPKAILHNLDTLERQLTTITDVSTNSLDAASRRVQKLTQETERLEEARKAARASQEAVSSPVQTRQPSDTPPIAELPEISGAYIEDPERVAKINALYGTLATIEQLSPTLPLVLDRLRTLRLIHTSAGTASATLDDLEKRQGEQAEEIKQWREALAKVEENLNTGEGTLQNNIKTVGEWVRDLEARIAKFS
ncbi:Dynamitin-domain-containing protein [Phyllosticta citricarpa]|uniref:Dynamitin-domain-containing protein n=1 Tax=Phyllosticta citricarpa TaxID=55181 RepID=A0ABR1MN31_9PEZI